MAREVRRVAPAYWIQTPNFWFPMEPHFLVPGWQWLPEDVRIAILQRREVGHFGREPVREDARRVVRGSQLLTRRRMQELFPDSTLVGERYGWLVKSWTAVRGLPLSSGSSAQRRATAGPGPGLLELRGERQERRLVVRPADDLHGEREAGG
jgi:hypothetical protein